MPHAVGLLLHNPGGTAALPGYFIADTPWAGTKTTTNFGTIGQDSALLSGGGIQNSVGQNDLYTTDFYLSAGTYKVALICVTDLNRGIYNITGINGTQTVDGYSAGAVNNVYTEVTGIAVTAGVKTVQNQMATKNASSSGYAATLQTFALVRTGA